MFETLMWIGIYFGIAFLVSRLFTFPYSLIIIVLAVIGLGVYRRRRYFRKAGQATSSGSSVLWQLVWLSKEYKFLLYELRNKT